MQDYRAPGVRIEHVLSEPARVLRTGVPVFLGLVSEAAVDAHNAEHENPDDRFLCRPLSNSMSAIVRKQGYVKLPSRASDSADEPQISDRSSSDLTMYLLSMPLKPRGPSYRAKVRRSRGAAGPGLAVPAVAGHQDEEEIMVRAISPKPQRFSLWPQFQQTYGDLASAGFLSYAVRGFFENGGTLCYVQVISYPEAAEAEGAHAHLEQALRAGLASLEQYDEYDLICVPDLMWEAAGRPDKRWIGWITDLQNIVLAHCTGLGDRMAILDAVNAGVGDVQTQRDLLGAWANAPLPAGKGRPGKAAGAVALTSPSEPTPGAQAHAGTPDGQYGALYYPWLRVPAGPETTDGYVPPCGHVAGIYARSDERVGVHKAPANEVVEGVIDLADHLSDDEQGPLNNMNINCLRAFPRRGIRVWGARTLSRTTTWRFVNVLRVILTAARWITHNMNDVVYEPNSPRLWDRVTRELNAYFADLTRRGALDAPPGQAAFYVKCDAETNPPETREVGMLVTEIGLRPAAPAEFIVIRIIHGQAGVEIVVAQPQAIDNSQQGQS